MNDETPTTKTTPRETLTGDRLCMQCLHPLVGRTIEREATTGLLYVRCGECATASALFEYPAAAPWMHRMKTVAASTFAVFAIFAVLALGGVTGGFTAGSAQVATDASAASIVPLTEEKRTLTVQGSHGGRRRQTERDTSGPLAYYARSVCDAQ